MLLFGHAAKTYSLQRHSINYSRLLFTIFSAVGGILVFAIWSNIHAYAQQSSLPPSTASSPSTMISPEIKAKMCDPSNPSLKVVNTTEARICGIPKTVKPPLLSSAAPQTMTSSLSAAPSAQFPNSIASGNNSSKTTKTTNVPIVLRPLAGGICSTGYHLVSEAVCIKDLPSAAPTKTTPRPTPTIPATTTTNATKSFPIPSPSAASQPSSANPTDNDKNSKNSNNEENFNTKILKSFNKKFK
ncbi:MAG: hypothetical protein ACJ71K_17725 [Nitrososphaeraceae archaeon]